MSNFIFSIQYGLRLLTHGANRFARFVFWFSLLGLFLGVMVLTVVVTVMNGFDQELKKRLLGSIPHATIEGVSAAELRQNKLLDGVQDASLRDYFEGFGALTANGQVYPLKVRAFSNQPDADAPNTESAAQPSEVMLADSVVRGTWSDLYASPRAIVLGEPVARALGLRVGDSVMLLLLSAADGSVQPRPVRCVLAATFELGAQVDYGQAFVNKARLPDTEWRRFGRVGTQLHFTDPLQAPGVVASWQSEVQGSALVDLQPQQLASWATEYGELFAAVQLEKSMMFLLLLLVVAIAAFNIIAGQSMIVSDKRSNIAILRTMGANKGFVLRSFMVQGIVISVIGTVSGLFAGTFVANHINEILDAVQALTGMHLLDGSYFVRVPVAVEVSDLLTISGMSVGLCLLAAWIPARRATALNPVDALHR